ncbi:hypothetical protein SSBR45G_58050 [Bradyrhizobium sp. SSBR45G]|nr:hypothetical protein SSBR45G_58050 [Bradyrhizobium sp. SSBR45G]GLH88368.1 hypothetical protein SSBR45R_58290 [Bradyrhizobium sp. SSBR45R]
MSATGENEKHNSLIPSFRGARSASPESITTIVSMDSGLVPLRVTPRNDTEYGAPTVHVASTVMMDSLLASEGKAATSPDAGLLRVIASAAKQSRTEQGIWIASLRSQ